MTAAAAAVLLVVAGAALGLWAVILPIAPTASTTELYPPVPAPSAIPIRHIVVLMMENHAFDNYFGVYCPSPGPYCSEPANGIPPGTCLPLYPLQPLAGCVAPYPVSQTGANISEPDIPHDWQPAHVAYDGGRMDGFYLAESSSTEPFGYYTQTQIPVYWDLAEQYALGDNFYSSALSYSLGNHWYLIAGQSPSQAVSTQVDVTRYPHQPFPNLQKVYLAQANRTATVADLLARTSVTWKYYDYPLPSYGAALQHGGGPGAFDYWNPLAAKAESYTASFLPHFVNRDAFYNDSRNGALPNVSWVIPAVNQSDHPPMNLRDGQAYVLSVVRAVESSPEWNSTALFVSWDEYGGYYDHVAPPAMDANGLSFRVPLLVISPYTPENAVTHTFAYFGSLLRFVEWRFALGSVTSADARAPLPLGYFDFAAAPRAPWTNVGSLGSYPVPLQPGGPPNAPRDFAASPAPGGGLTLRWATPLGGAPVGGYRLTVDAAGSGGPSTLLLDGGATGVTLPGLAGGRTYSFSLVAFAGPADSTAASASAVAASAPMSSLVSAPLGTAIGVVLALGIAAAWLLRRLARSPG